MAVLHLQALPSLGSTVKVCIALLSLYLTSWVVYARYFHPLSGIPGPFWASITRLWLMKKAHDGHLDQVLLNLHRRLGPLVRIAPNEVITSDPKAIRLIYGSKVDFPKTEFYIHLSTRLSPNGNMFSVLDGELHDQRRKIVSHLYSMASILEQEKYIDLCTDLFGQKLRKLAQRGEVVDFGVWVQLYLFDIIGELYLGKQFGFMKEEGDYGGYIESQHLFVATVSWAAFLPSYAQGPLMLTGLILPSTRKAFAALGRLEKLAIDCVTERQHHLREGSSRRQDHLAKVLAIHNERGEKVNFILEDVYMEAFIAFAVGSDTTAIAIRSIIYHVLKNPTIYRTLVEEIDAADQEGCLSRPNVRYTEAMKLPYLVACCKEGMRVHPSISFPLPRHVPAGGREITGRFIPEGYTVGISAATIHQDRDIFGPDAAIFNPDRWFREDAANMDRYMFHFGAGKRNCIGKNISLVEIHKFLPQVLRDYHLELEDPAREWKTENRFFHQQSGLRMRVLKRF